MPTIPIYQSRIPAPRPDESVAGVFARGGEVIGGVFQKAAEQASDLTATIEAPELNKRRADLFNDTYEKIQEAIKNGNVNDPNFTQDLINNTLAPAADQLRGGWFSEKTRAQANEYAQYMTEHLLRYSLESISRESGDRATESLTTQQNDSEKFVMLHPETLDAKLQETGAAIDSLKAAHGTTAEVSANLEKARPELLGRIADAGLRGVVASAALANDPAQVDRAMGLITDEKSSYYRNATPGGLASAIADLNKIKSTIGSTQSEIAAQAIPDLVEQAKKTGAAPPALVALATGYIGPNDKDTAVKRAEITRQMNEAVAYGKVAVGVRNMPEDEGWKLVQDLNEKLKAETDPNALGPERAQIKATIETLQERARAYRKDPAGYMTDPENNPVIAVKYAQWKKDQTSESFAAYAVASAAEQRRLFGANVRVPELATADVKNAAATAIANVTSPEGATQAANALGQLRNSVGPQYWSQVVQEMQHDKILTGDAGVAAALVGRPESQALAENILYASAVSGGNRFAIHQIPEAKAMALAIPAFSKLQASLANTGSRGNELVNSYVTALAHVVQYNGVKDANAASVLADKMGQGQFSFPSGEPSLRVPTGIDADRVADGAKSVQADVGNHNLVVPPSYSGLGPNDQKKNYAAQIEATGRWYTNEDGSGALLYDEDMHNVQEIVNGKAVDVELKWDDLGKVADKGLLRATFKGAASALDTAVKSLGGQ